MSTKYKLRITGECKQNMKLCKRRGSVDFSREIDEARSILSKANF